MCKLDLIATSRSICPKRQRKLILSTMRFQNCYLARAKWCHPGIPTRQMVWLLTVVCLQNLGDCWIRHIRPDWTEEFAKIADKNTGETLELYTGVNMDSWSTYSQEHMRLPMSMKDCVLRQATDRKHAQFIGAMAQSIPRVFNRMDSNGN